MHDNRPLIGITTRQEPGKSDFYLPRYYAEAIYEAGGTPFLIPLLDAHAYMDHVLKCVDGIVFSGSATDIDPRLYGEMAVPELGAVNPLRDAVDMYLAEAAIRADLPIFGICYGCQMLNVLLGGSLVQDLPSQRPGNVKHAPQEGESLPRHSVSLAPGSLFAKLAGSLEVEVNSSHHQAIGRLAAGLAPVAKSRDGIIEAAVAISGKPLLAVQWHPEKSYSKDPFSRRLFEHFIRVCAES
jgi:putative glutamine amidotransferase